MYIFINNVYVCTCVCVKVLMNIIEFVQHMSLARSSDYEAQKCIEKFFMYIFDMNRWNTQLNTLF